MQRIMGVKYSFPSNLQLSKDCVDLISRIFVGNPANRVNITGIRAHAWFLKNLPDELRVCHSSSAAACCLLCAVACVSSGCLCSRLTRTCAGAP